MFIINFSRSSELASGGPGPDARATMPELTNLTDRISHLRDREGNSPLGKGDGTPEPNEKPGRKRRRPERKFATDYFMLFVYALLAVALVAQLGLIVWLDVI